MRKSWLAQGRSPRKARPGWQRWGERPGLRVEPLEDRTCPSITFLFDYSLDASGFFNNPAARAVLEQAGRDLGDHLNDTLTAISPGGGNHWAASFDDPSTGVLRTVTDLNIPANTLYVFAGGRNYGGLTVGEGGFGGYSVSGSSAWINTVAARGQAGALAASPTDVGPWGGSVSFDVVTNWSFGGPGVPLAWYQYDFYSVALHELGHLLGMGTASSWNRLVVGGYFYGPNSYAAVDQAGYPAVDASGAHWAPGTTSQGVEADMTPAIRAGMQKPFTRLDFAGLQDIGWQVDSALTTTAPVTFGSAAVRTGAKTIGAYDRSTATWYLRSSLSAGAPDQGVIQYGGAGWVAVVGDWNGDGVETLGVYDPQRALWYLRNSNSPGAPDYTPFQYGFAGAIPVVGDWLGTGRTGIGVFDPVTATWYLRATATPGAPDLKPFQYGGSGWAPVVGDWAGAGHTGIGVFDPITAIWYIRNTASSGAPDVAPFQYGGAGWAPVAGDWTGNGRSGIGVVRLDTETWYLRNTTSSGAPDWTPYSYGGAGWVPVAGAWQSAATASRRSNRARDTAAAAVSDATSSDVVADPELPAELRPSRPCCGCPACLAAARLHQTSLRNSGNSVPRTASAARLGPAGTLAAANADAVWILAMEPAPLREGQGDLLAPFAFGFHS